MIPWMGKVINVNYFEKSICQNIPKHLVIVIDNAPYHSKNTENYPTSKWRKQQFVDWLTEKNITFLVRY